MAFVRGLSNLEPQTLSEIEKPDSWSGFSLRQKARLSGRLVPHYGFFCLDGCFGGWGDGGDGDDAFDRLLAQHVLAIELGHLGVFGILLHLGVAGADLFFAGVLGDARLLEGVVGGGVHVLLVAAAVVCCASPMPTFLPPAKIS